MPSSRYIFGTLPWYSVLVVAGMVVAILLAMREEKRVALPEDTILDLSLWMLPIGVVGARLYYVIFSWSEYADDPLSVLFIWQGGLAIYGGLIAGGITVLVFCLRRKLQPLQLLDVLAPGVVLAQAIGRWGNYFNMEAYGAEVTVPALQFFPMAVQIYENGGIVWHQATFFYESCWDLAVFLVLWLGRKKSRRTGDTFLHYVLLYGLGRQLIEPMRADSLVGGGFRVSQLIAVLAAVAVLWVFTLRRMHRPQLRRTLAGIVSAAGLLTLIPGLPALIRLVWAVTVIGLQIYNEGRGSASCQPVR